MNIGPLRRTIIKEMVIFVVILLLLAAAAWYLGDMRDGIAQQHAAVETETQQTVATRQGLESKFKAVQENMPVYHESKKHLQDPGLFIDSQAVRDLFNYYQPVFFLKKIVVDMQPVSSITDDPKFVRQHFTGTKTTAKISVEAASDEDVYSLINVMKKELPGFINVTSLSLNKPKPLSQDTLAQLRKDGLTTAVMAEFSFDWYGLRALDTDNTINKYVPKKRESLIP